MFLIISLIQFGIAAVIADSFEQTNDLCPQRFDAPIPDVAFTALAQYAITGFICIGHAEAENALAILQSAFGDVRQIYDTAISASDVSNIFFDVELVMHNAIQLITDDTVRFFNTERELMDNILRKYQNTADRYT